jgi:type IV secretory pathway VirB4 component
MLTNFKKHIFFSALFLCNLSSMALAVELADKAEIQKKWVIELFRAQPAVSNIVVLGPTFNGKSTLINMLIHTSGYATHMTGENVLLNSEDPTTPIYHQDIFRFDVQNQ